MYIFADLILNAKAKLKPLMNFEVEFHFSKSYKTKIWVLLFILLFLFVFGFISGFLSSSFDFISKILSTPVFASVFGASILGLSYIKGKERAEIFKLSEQRLDVISHLHHIKSPSNEEIEKFCINIVRYFSFTAIKKTFDLIIKIKLNQEFEKAKQELLIELNSEVFSSPFKNNLNKAKIDGKFLLSELQWLFTAQKQEIQQKQALLSKIFIAETDTIPGIFCNIRDKSSAEQIYTIKGRSLSKPLAIYSSNPIKYLEKNPIIDALLTKFKDVPMTIVAKASADVPKFLLKNGSVGVRILTESSPFYAFLKEYNLTLIGTSANFSNDVSPTDIKSINQEFAKDLPILEFNKSSTKLQSSVIKIEENKITIIRGGAFAEEINNWIQTLNPTAISILEEGEEKQSYIINL